MLGVVGVFMLEPIAQDPGYHLFKDQRTVFGVPNFWNVITSLPFLLVGVAGLYGILRSRRVRLLDGMKAAYTLFFLGVSLVAVGSGYYHLSPNNESLVWDRIPMAVAIMALFSIIIGEFISLSWGKYALWPLVVFGVFSVLYWQGTEHSGEGDLRLYALVQFLPMLVIPIILLTFKPAFTGISGYWFLLGAYALGKVFEFADGAVQDMLLLLSGHSIKHIVVALGVAFLLKAYNHRKLVV
ncbi:MAG: ceramidase domain-containing protein [Gammaproteobacteria bacterium]|nr:ceramidase domain-containing protein [Gammaproteobacteria bacterium]